MSEKAWKSIISKQGDRQDIGYPCKIIWKEEIGKSYSFNKLRLWFLFGNGLKISKFHNKKF
jgi:hypothetical protein